MTEEISALQQEVTTLKMELESERFKQRFSEEVIQVEKQKNEKQEEQLTLKQQTIQELTQQLKENRITDQVVPLDSEIDSDKVNTLEQSLRAISLESNTLKIENERLHKLLNESQNLASQPDSFHSKRIAELMKANQQLKLELATVQQSIGEVMLLAQQQATEMIAVAEKKSAIIVSEASQELLNIGFKATQLASDVKQSQQQVNTVYEDLTSCLTDLAEKEFHQ